MATTTYTGGCHCGKVRYEVTTDLAKIIACNCSICSTRGYLLNFVDPSTFKLLSGEGMLKDYLFNKQVIHHPFCTECGVTSFGWSKMGDKEVRFVNVRCLDGVDPTTLELTPYDGRSA